MNDLKLEPGKRYETRDGRIAFVRSISGGGKSMMGSVVGYEGQVEWLNNGSAKDWYSRNLCLVRTIGDQPELVDLTKIDVPFGELDERTQDRMAGAWARGSDVEYKSRDSHRWHDIKRRSPGWFDKEVYRIKPTYTMPTVDDAVWQALPNAKAITWNKDKIVPRAHTETPRRGERTWMPVVGEMMRLDEVFFGDLIRRGDCPWDQAIVLRPEGL